MYAVILCHNSDFVSVMSKKFKTLTAAKKALKYWKATSVITNSYKIIKI